MPGQVNPGDWAYKWGGRRFASFSHACRDVFLALERDDQDELKRLAGLCSLDVQVGSLINVLLEICMEPFQPAYLERLPRQYRDLLLYAALHHPDLRSGPGSPRLCVRAGLDSGQPARPRKIPPGASASTTWSSGTSWQAISTGPRPCWIRSPTWTPMLFEACWSCCRAESRRPIRRMTWPCKKRAKPRRPNWSTSGRFPRCCTPCSWSSPSSRRIASVPGPGWIGSPKTGTMRLTMRPIVSWRRCLHGMRAVMSTMAQTPCGGPFMAGAALWARLPST